MSNKKYAYNYDIEECNQLFKRGVFPIDAHNAQIDLLNKKKKLLQDELDALEDKVRDENLILDLQQKQYNLAKAENQRSKLVNYMPDAIVI